MGRAAKHKQQRHVQPQDTPKSTPSQVRYVLFEPKSKNYLALSELLGGMERLDWCPYPGGAHQFASLGQAQAKAKRIVKNRGYNLQIIELTTDEGQFKTQLITELMP
ncbi:MAG: hypothetical protein ICV63_10600 [Coleofasciculus sp. Co-bin14]|nr:hypothetical protein [Coleofasciculus sp. Co-bin14]